VEGASGSMEFINVKICAKGQCDGLRIRKDHL